MCLRQVLGRLPGGTLNFIRPIQSIDYSHKDCYTNFKGNITNLNESITITSQLKTIELFPNPIVLTVDQRVLLEHSRLLVKRLTLLATTAVIITGPSDSDR